MRPDLDTSRGVCFTIILGHVLYIQKVGARNVYCKKSGQKMYIAKSLGQKMYNPQEKFEDQSIFLEKGKKYFYDCSRRIFAKLEIARFFGEIGHVIFVLGDLG